MRHSTPLQTAPVGHSIGVAQQWLLAFMLLALPNITFWWTAHYFGYQRPWFNIDYGLAYVLWLLGWRWLGFFAALLALAIDVLAGASQVYLLFDPGQLVQLLAFARQARPGFVVFFVALLLLNGCFYGVVAFFLARRKVTAKVLLSALAPLVLANIGPMLAELEYQQANLQLDRRTVILGSQIDYLHRMFFRSDIGHHLAELSNDETSFSPWTDQTAVENGWGKSDTLPRHLLLVVVESWGVPRNTDELEKQLLTLARPDAIELVSSGAVPFSGGTVAGELRELCKITSSKIYFKSNHAGELNCWPRRLKEMGYATTAFHAASGAMYQRNEWYAAIGFDRTYFMENYPRDAGRCYSFPGLCDTDMAPFIVETLAASKKSFVYWMTLNSHLPYDAKDLRDGPSADCAAFGMPADSPRCAHYSLISQTFSRLIDALLKSGLHDTEIVLVGDHQPPFMQEGDRAAFVEHIVPFAHIRLKDAIVSRFLHTVPPTK